MSEDIQNAFDAIVGDSYSAHHREVLNRTAHLSFELLPEISKKVAKAIPDRFFEADDYDLVDDMMQFGIATSYDILEVEYWLLTLTGE